uniref:guanylate cyclase n=1 Tax=Ditylum brightwellii TaxID=49249 RepID=A0A7S2EGV0_9STRA|mmetsp:Transcript_28874/g.42917  ORF Transcript_28874/g.42917 Transcript_28874/m.42917 type:complete len:1110 (+) Transcript_28874:99-3428(+)
MFGWINDCTEQLVITKFGIEKWHEIKEKAGCSVKDHGFVRHQYYPDSSTVNLVVAASDVLGIPVSGVLEAFGQFFMEFVRKNGYENLLRCQGSTLRLWLSNLNALHDHLQSSLPAGFVAPVFWCEDCDSVQGSILLHYFSKRGSLLCPLVVGVVKEVARFHFDFEIEMELLATQGEEESEFTTWRISTNDPKEQWRLTTKEGVDENMSEKIVSDEYEESPEQTTTPMTCPFTGMTFTTVGNGDLDKGIEDPESYKSIQGEGISWQKMQSVFPFHILVDSDFKIHQVGKRLPNLLHCKTKKLVGRKIGEVLDITRPVLGSEWNWPALHKLADQIFSIKPKQLTDTPKTRTTFVEEIKFKGSMLHISDDSIMFILSPDAKNVSELNSMGLTMSDLSLHSFQRDAIFLGEHISSEVKSAHELDRLSKRLKNEKDLSNTLLYNMLPRSVADELRSGLTVDPTHYDKVTLFFSDVVGFTSICDAIEPWEVIDMLNQLYSVMDYLAMRFNLYKVETIGDAYMCCSGLPIPDDMHAENIANFALAVSECVRHVKSPADGKPIRLRIGIHTGHCMAGVVGTLTPHYCLFGDMINTTARHESTGEAGKIQSSSILYGRLMHFSAHQTQQYKFTPRGLVPMKGKGELFTYWLDEGTDDNKEVNPVAIRKLYDEVGEVLGKKKWKKRRYFRRGSALGGASVAGSDGLTMFDSRSQKSASNKDAESVTDDVDDQDHDISSEVESNYSNVEEREKSLQELDDMINGDNDLSSPEESPEDAALGSADKLQCTIDSWKNVCWDVNLTREDLVENIHKLMMAILSKCFGDGIDYDPDIDFLDKQLYGFVHRISTLYRDENRFHNWRHACHVALGATFLIEKAQEVGEEDPWIQFIVAFSALIHDVKHFGVNNSQLQLEQHAVWQIYDNGSCQERYSMHCGLSIFIEEFPELSREFLQGCPMFLRLVSSAVLATDISSSEVQRKVKEKFEAVMADESDSSKSKCERTEAALEHILLLADVGHCSQKYDTFLRWNRAFYEECFVNYLNERGIDPRNGWYEGQIRFLEKYVMPLATRCESLMHLSCPLTTGVQSILGRWRLEGAEWTEQMIEELWRKKDSTEIICSDG